MEEKIREAIKKLDSLSKGKKIKVISHYDTDGITSAAIFSRALQRANKSFSIDVIKNLEIEYIESLSENDILIFLDLGSGSLNHLAKKKTDIFIFDHHEISSEIPENITMINPLLFAGENVASSALCYLFAVSLSEQNKDLSNLAVIGMIGDMLDAEIGKTYEKILRDSEVIIKRGLLLYPATRPLDKVLENSLSFYIPGVTGSASGTLELLRDADLQKNSKSFKSLAELTEKEMSSIITAIMLKRSENNSISDSDLIGKFYLVKFFNRLEDARELSALINACGRMDCPYIALGFCLGNKSLKGEAEKIYTKYKKTISSALEQISEIEKIEGKNYTIINAQDKIKDTIIGTLASIISFSPLYPEGTIIITMAYLEEKNKVKVSARLAGRKGRNVREILHKASIPISCEVGGHPNAAGCLIPREKEQEFINNLRQQLEIEIVKVNS